MGSNVLQNLDTYWDHEPGREALTPALSHLRFAAEGEGGRDGRFMESGRSVLVFKKGRIPARMRLCHENPSWDGGRFLHGDVSW